MIYFLCRFLHDVRFDDKRFALEFQSGEYIYYTPSASGQGFDCYENIHGHEFPITDVLVLADILELQGPQKRAKWTLVFTSPDPARYNGFLKMHRTYRLLLPTWSQDELYFVNRNMASWYDRFVVCGGIARIVLWDGKGLDPMAGILATLRANAATVTDYFFSKGFGDMDPNTSYTFVHMNPPCNDDGRVMYDANVPVYTFASDALFLELVNIHRASLVASAVDLFYTGGSLASLMLGAVSADNLFQKICLWLVPLANTIINPVALNASFARLGDIVLPNIEVLVHNWKELQ